MKKAEGRTLLKREKAQGMVEFALTLPILLMLIFGIFEFGRLLFVYSAVVTASREAARYGSAAGDIGSGTLRFMDCSGITAAATRVGILANITSVNISYDSGPGTPVLYPGCPPGPIEGGKNRVVVEVISSYEPVVPLVNVGTLTLSSKSARTIFSNIEVGQYPPNPAHIADLDGSTSAHSPKWDAQVTILAKDEENNPVENATVSGSWNVGGSPSMSCLTDASGVCILIIYDLPNGKKDVTFTVIDIIHTEKSYDPLANGDPDGDSDGTSITMNRPW